MRMFATSSVRVMLQLHRRCYWGYLRFPSCLDWLSSARCAPPGRDSTRPLRQPLLRAGAVAAVVLRAAVMALHSHAPPLLPLVQPLAVEIPLAALARPPSSLSSGCSCTASRCPGAASARAFAAALGAAACGRDYIRRPCSPSFEPEQWLQLYCEPLPWRCFCTRLRCCPWCSSLRSRLHSPPLLALLRA